VKFTMTELANCCCGPGFLPELRFVEFGCGLGYVTRWAASEGARATGIDASEEQVAVAGRLAREPD